ncbi:MAG: nucleotidyltransferase family protein [Rhodospirillales bacterium]
MSEFVAKQASLIAFIKAVAHTAPGRAVHALIEPALAHFDGGVSNADIATTIDTVRAEVKMWNLYHAFDNHRLECLARGISDPRQYDVSWGMRGEPPASGATWAAVREMAVNRVRFKPWEAASVVAELQSLESEFRALGVNEMVLFGSCANGRWRDNSSDIDVAIRVEDRGASYSIAGAVGELCSEVFGYEWDASTLYDFESDFAKLAHAYWIPVFKRTAES